MRNCFKLHCSYFLLLFLGACGVKGPLYLPPPPTTPSMPSAPEPQGKLYSKEATGSNLSQPKNASSNTPSEPLSLDNKQLTPSTSKN